MKKRKKIAKKPVRTKTLRARAKRKNPDETKVILATYIMLSLKAILTKIKNDPYSLFLLTEKTLENIVLTIQNTAKLIGIQIVKPLLRTKNEKMLYVVAIISELYDNISKHPTAVYELPSGLLSNIANDIFSISENVGLLLQGPPNGFTDVKYKQFLLDQSRSKKFSFDETAVRRPTRLMFP